MRCFHRVSIELWSSKIFASSVVRRTSERRTKSYRRKPLFFVREFIRLLLRLLVLGRTRTRLTISFPRSGFQGTSVSTAVAGLFLCWRGARRRKVHVGDCSMAEIPPVLYSACDELYELLFEARERISSFTLACRHVTIMRDWWWRWVLHVDLWSGELRIPLSLAERASTTQLNWRNRQNRMRV